MASCSPKLRTDATDRPQPWRRRHAVLGRLLAFAALGTIALPAAQLHAIDSARTAVTLVQQAAKAYEVGDFVKAADLYQKAYRLDASPAYLWALARSEHLAGQNEGAIDHYRAFIANPGVESARVGKAQAYLAEVEQEVNKTRVREADSATRAGNPALAAELYLQAHKKAPGHVEWLFKAAVAEQMAESFPSALQHFEVYLATAPPTAEERPQAVAREAFLRKKLGLSPQKPTEPPAPLATAPETAAPPKPAATVATAAPAVDHVSQPAVAGAPSWPGWTALAAGAVVAGGGVALLVGATADADQLSSDQAHPPEQKITALSREAALNRASSINTRLALGGTATGLGVLAAGFGTWWLLHHPAQSAVLLPTGNGASLAVRF